MQASESTKEIAAALAKVQAQIRGAKRDSENPYFNSKYADLASVWDACRDLLAANNLSIVQLAESTDGLTVSVTTRLMHTSGEHISGSLTVKPAKADPQGIGSAITYARRYTLAAMVGVCPEDDDGNAASNPEAPPAQRQTPPRNGTNGHANGTNGKPANGKATIDIRKVFQVQLKQWSGLQSEDLLSAVNKIKVMHGMEPNAPATDEQVSALIKFVADNKSKKFMEVVK